MYFSVDLAAGGVRAGPLHPTEDQRDQAGPKGPPQNQARTLGQAFLCIIEEEGIRTPGDLIVKGTVSPV